MLDSNTSVSSEPLKAANELTLRLGTLLDLEQMVKQLPRAVIDMARVERVALLIADDDQVTLRLYGVEGANVPSDVHTLRERVFFSIFNRDDIPEVAAWQNGQTYAVTADALPDNSPLAAPVAALKLDEFLTVPLRVADRLAGVLLVDNPRSHAPVDEAKRDLLAAIAPSAATALHNATLHSKIVKELASKMHQLHILHQIDRELNDTIKQDHVFDMTLDWALRFTNAQAGALAIYEDDRDELRFVADLGYDMPADQREMLRRTQGGGIALRVARAGSAEVIPDVSADNDYIMLSNVVRSHMSVPVMREDRVIAVISVESKRLNGISEEHQDFVEKLAARAGVAIDNARLFSETVREREKLSYILANITDVVIVAGLDENLMLLNHSAVAALRLYPDVDYTGTPMAELLDGSPLLDVFRRGTAQTQNMIEEVKLPNERTYYTHLSPHRKIGWIIVMHDITPLKETEQLKNELVATVTHDLKQPLTVMNGYLEMLQMHQKLEQRSESYVKMIVRAVQTMWDLIDDLMMMAKIEAGIRLDLRPVSAHTVVEECIDQIKSIADSKLMEIKNEIKLDLPQIKGDPKRLSQVFANLIGNAVKYTPPEGHVRVWAEKRDHALMIAIQDNGLGISPEDQARIFDRFYRVRRAETDSIEGTGLGLAIVKRLVEAHRGQIGLESHLGEGSTFYVTLPAYDAGEVMENTTTVA
jgi:signal transduction histidine kinase